MWCETKGGEENRGERERDGNQRGVDGEENKGREKRE